MPSYNLVRTTATSYQGKYLMETLVAGLSSLGIFVIKTDQGNLGKATRDRYLRSWQLCTPPSTWRAPQTTCSNRSRITYDLVVFIFIAKYLGMHTHLPPTTRCWHAKYILYLGIKIKTLCFFIPESFMIHTYSNNGQY